MIHRAPFGSMEKILRYSSNILPADSPLGYPTQCHILTISENTQEYAAIVANRLRENGIRVEIDDGDGTIGKKIRTHRKLHPAYMVILGDGRQKATLSA